MIPKIAALAAAAFLTIVASPALAEDDQMLRAAAESYVRHPVTQHAMDSVMSMDTLRPGVVTQLQARGAELSSDQVEVVSQILLEELNRLRPQLETLMIEITIKIYTLEEIQALIEFNGSEYGASTMMKIGEMMRSFTVEATPLFQQLLERLGDRIEAELPQ